MLPGRFAALSLLVALGACGGAPASGPRAPGEGHASVAVAPVAEDRFADAVRELLLTEPKSEARRALLAQVVSRQLVRSAAHFDGNLPDRGLASLTGAVVLASVGELDAAALGPGAKRAFAGAAKELAARGDEGAAFAAYAVLVRLSPESERKEIEGHLDAIARWLRDLGTGAPPMASANLAKNAAIARAVLEPSEAALNEAAVRTVEWFDRALELRAKYRSAQVPRAIDRREREEALLAHGTLRTAPLVLACLFLRHADAKGAAAALERVHAREIAPQLAQAVEAARGGSAAAWLELLRAVRPEEPDPRLRPDDRDDEMERPMQSIQRAAQFRVAAEAFRADPTAVDAAGDVALALLEFDMLEAAPLVLADAVKVHPEPRTVAASLALTMQALSRSADGDGARRVFRAATPLLALGDAAGAKVQPSPSSVRALMGQLELRDGHVGEARALLERAAMLERSGGLSLTLAQIARSDGQTEVALKHVDEALSAPDTTRAPALRGEVLLTRAELLRERGDKRAAQAALTDALRGLATARKIATDELKARVERTLAKVLDRFGASEKARQALERAYDAAPRDKGEASATLLTMASRALRASDLAAARDGLRRAVAADLPSEDLVYVALWVRIVERLKKSSADPLAERAMSGIKDDGRWTGRLATFAQGKLPLADLVAAAKTPAQKAEALFYTAMEQRIAGDERAATATLQRVVKASGGIELMEVAIARDLLAGGDGALGPAPDVGLP